VTLGCPNSLTIVGELKTFLVILRHDCIKFFARDSVTAGGTPLEQVIDTAPTGIIESQPSFLGLVPEYKAEEFARSYLILIHIYKCRCFGCL
jgi:hypothetical protein